MSEQLGQAAAVEAILSVLVERVQLSPDDRAEIERRGDALGAVLGAGFRLGFLKTVDRAFAQSRVLDPAYEFEPESRR